ncbi:MAG: hypothetical protein JWM21_4721 [Acidobacteria bacterium]|nr:hypothetical protein [Acidobacteriota bacterium]
MRTNMKLKTILAILASFIVFAGSHASSAYSQTSAVPQNPKVEGAQDRDALSLTENQKAQFKSIHQSSRAQLRSLRNDQTLSPEQRQAKASSIREAAHQQVLGILTPQQQEIVKNHKREGHGFGHGFTRRDGSGDRGRVALGLNDDQRSQLKTLHQSTRDQVATIRNDSTLSSEQKAEKIGSIHQSTRQQVSGILTPEQRDKMREHRRHRRDGEGGGRRGGFPGPRVEKP